MMGRHGPHPPVPRPCFWAGVEHAEKVFMGDADVTHTLRQLVAALAEVNVFQAIVGAIALNEYGYCRVTTDVSVLLTAEGLAVFKTHWLGRGYVEKIAVADHRGRLEPRR